MHGRFALVISAALIVILQVGAVYPPDEPAGRIVLYVKNNDGLYVIQSMSIEREATPLPTDTNSASFTFRDRSGQVVAEGPALVRNRIFHDAVVDDNGKLDGFSETIEDSLVISLPYYPGAATVECRLPMKAVTVQGDLRQIPRERSILPVGIADKYSNPPSYRAYLDSLFRNQLHFFHQEPLEDSRVAPSAGMVDAYVRVNVKKLPAGIDGFIQVWLNNADPSGKKISKYFSFEGLNKTHSMELEPLIYSAHILASYYVPEGFGRSIRIGATKQHLNFDPSKTSPSNPATLNINFNYLTTVKVINEHGDMVSARVNVVDHMKKSKRMLSSIMADTRATGFTPQEVQFRLPAGAKVFVVDPWQAELYSETMQVEIIKKNDDNSVTIIIPSYKKAKGSKLKQIWPVSNTASGAATKGKLNIIFLSEAYTSRNETFTDLNNNGYWDGDLLLDENGNSKFDKSPSREIFIDRNQNDEYDPPEPFTDANGDGICNRNERAKFEMDCAFATTAFLNMPPFNRFTERINVFTYWVPSKHGVQKITEAIPWQNMKTAFGVYCTEGGCFRKGTITNPSLVYNTAKRALPDYTVPVVMVSDPFIILRSNASFNFGRVLLTATGSDSGNVLIHEFGHSIGNLEDEYVTAPGHYSGAEPWSANLTTVTDPKKVKWKRFIKGDIESPTPLDYEGYGIFEGGAYGDTGIYRPTPTSMMRESSYPFYKVNEAQLKKILKKFKK